MLLGSSEQLDHLIVKSFASVQEITAQELHQEICRRYRMCTLRAIYKELDKLIADGIIVKARGSFRLSMIWMLNLSSFAEHILAEALSPAGLQKLLPREGMKLKWQFTDLHALDRFLVQLLFSMIQVSQSKVQFYWQPHQWFHLLSPNQGKMESLGLRRLDECSYTVYGSGTFLERLHEASWDTRRYHWSFPPHAFDSDPSKYISVIDTYVLTTRLDSKTNKKLKDMFNTITDESKIDHDLVRQTLGGKVRCSLTLENSRRKSAVLRTRFCDHFQITDPYNETA